MVTNEITHVIMKNVDPSSALAEILLSLMKADGVLRVDDCADEMAEKISGAPFPKASRVTPASDSDIPDLIVSLSRAGERYSSAVSLKR